MSHSYEESLFLIYLKQLNRNIMFFLLVKYNWDKMIFQKLDTRKHETILKEMYG